MQTWAEGHAAVDGWIAVPSVLGTEPRAIRIFCRFFR
jgi:hypothetical protein